VPCYFGAAECRLFGWLHRASGPARMGGVLLCEPIGYDAILTHRTYRSMAEAFAVVGVTTLRFNYWGTGDSAGTDENGSSVEGWLASIDAARRELERVCGDGPITMVGLRMGGTLAMLSAAVRPVEQLVLFHPVVTGRSYLRGLRALAAITTNADAATDGDWTLEAGGFLVPPELQRTIEALTPQSVTQLPAAHVMLLHRDDLHVSSLLSKHLRALGAAVEEATVGGYADMMRDAHESVTPVAVITAIAAGLAKVHPLSCSGDDPAEPLPLEQQMWCTDPACAEPLVEEACVFAAAVPLFGIETRRRDADDRARTIVLLNSGAVHRIGPNRLYVTLAREWATLGYRVIRLDVSGTGDSGVLPTRRVADPYSSAHPDDVRQLVARLRTETPAMHLTLAGLCSGAYLSFTAARLGVPVERIVMINPLTFYWHDGDTLENLPVGHFAEVGYYASAMRDAVRWRRLLSGRSNLTSVVAMVARESLRQVRNVVEHVLQTSAPGGDDLAGDLTRMVERGLSAAFVFSEADPGRRLLEAQAGDTTRQLLQRRLIVMPLIAGADHTFSHSSYRSDLRCALSGLLRGST
jgi:pimeloyl-ACP methyl ester carboxylesterase